MTKEHQFQQTFLRSFRTVLGTRMFVASGTASLYGLRQRMTMTPMAWHSLMSSPTLSLLASLRAAPSALQLTQCMRYQMANKPLVPTANRVAPVGFRAACRAPAAARRLSLFLEFL